MQDACHGIHLIFPVSTLKMELFMTPNTQSVSTLLIIFVRLLKNAHTEVELCEIPPVPQGGATRRRTESFGRNAYMRSLL